MINFVDILSYIERKWLLAIDLATAFPLKSKLSGKFLHFNAIDGSIDILNKSWISKSYKWEISKNLTRPK